MRFVLLICTLSVLLLYVTPAQHTSITPIENKLKDTTSLDLDALNDLELNFNIPDSTAQDNDWISDSLNLDNLNIDTLVFEEYSPEEYFEYFPHFVATDMLKGSYYNFSVYNFNRANNITLPGFFSAKIPFSDNWDLENDMPEMKRGFDNNKTSDGFSSSFFEIGLSYIHTNKYTFPIHLQIGYQNITSSIHSINHNKSFIDHDGQSRVVKEANIIKLKEKLFQGTVMTELPIWGLGNMPAEVNSGSYYFGLLGLSGQFAFSSKADQIMQILSEETRIRYSSGNNYSYLSEDKTVQSINSFRSHLVFGIGINLVSNFFYVGINAIYKYPLNNLIKDVDWKHHYFIIQFEMALQQ